MSFAENTFIIPGLGNSGEGHWQTIWEKQFGFTRIQQRDWDTPVMQDWIDIIQRAVAEKDSSTVVLVGHSLACSTIGYWATKYKLKIRGALLVAPSDTEAEAYPKGTTGFAPMPLSQLPFRSIVVSSTDDVYVTPSRAKQFADAWGSKLILLENAGHINVAAGFGRWPEGIELLKSL